MAKPFLQCHRRFKNAMADLLEEDFSLAAEGQPLSMSG
jgi:hypothetical protein